MLALLRPATLILVILILLGFLSTLFAEGVELHQLKARTLLCDSVAQVKSSVATLQLTEGCKISKHQHLVELEGLTVYETNRHTFLFVKVIFYVTPELITRYSFVAQPLHVEPVVSEVDI